MNRPTLPTTTPRIALTPPRSPLSSILAAALAAQLALPALLPLPALAVLSSPDAKIARNSSAALRRAIPVYNNPVLKDMQRTIEDVAFFLRIPQRKPWGSMSDNVAKCIKTAQNESDMLRGVSAPDRTRATDLLAILVKQLQNLSGAIDSRDAEKTGRYVANSLECISELELLQAPGLPFAIPSEFASAPRLTGRAIVEVAIKTKDGRKVFVGPDNMTDRTVFRIVLDGFSAPITAGRFASNVVDHLLDNTRIGASPGALYIGEDHGQVTPLEILPMQAFEPVYKSPLDVQDGELPVLPLSINGSVAFSRSSAPDASNAYVSGDQAFIYLFDRQSMAGLAGLSFDEGQFGVMGYVTDGLELLTKLRNGDVIERATIIQGQERLVRPGGGADKT